MKNRLNLDRIFCAIVEPNFVSNWTIKFEFISIVHAYLNERIERNELNKKISRWTYDDVYVSIVAYVSFAT